MLYANKELLMHGYPALTSIRPCGEPGNLGSKKRAGKRRFQVRLASHHELPYRERSIYVPLRPLILKEYGLADTITNPGRSGGATPSPFPPGVPRPVSSLSVEDARDRPQKYQQSSTL
jgi:hypothetical protein